LRILTSMGARQRLRGSAGAVAAGLVAYVVLLAVVDVSPADSLAYVGYELAFVLLPGVLVYTALTRVARVGVRELAAGWGVGLLLELGAFALTAWAGVRGLYAVYPAVAVGGAAPFVRLERPGRREGVPARWSWALLAASALLIGWTANALLATPLPSRIYSAKGYSTDLLWATSMTGEALHHWPVDIPDLAGVPLHYHYFSFLDLAAASQVTGLDPWLVVFRLFPVVSAVVLVVQLFAAGRVVGGRVAVGLATVFLYFFVGRFFPWGTPFTDIAATFSTSPSFDFGLMLLIPALLETDRLARADGGLARASAMALIAIFTFAATGSKAPAGIVFVAALAVLCLWAAWAARRLLARLLVATAAAGAAFAVAWVDLFRGGPRGGTNFEPFGVVKVTQPFRLVDTHVPALVGYVLLVVLGVLAAAKLLAPLLAGLVIGARTAEPVLRTFSFAILAAGLAFYFAFFHVGSSERYFLWYGLLPASILAAIGYDRLLRGRLYPLPVARLGAAALLLLLVVWLVDLPRAPSPQFWDNLQHSRVDEPRYVALRWLEHHPSPRDVVAYDSAPDPDSCYLTAFAERRALEGCYLGLVPEKTFGPPAHLRSLLSAATFEQYWRRHMLNNEILAGDRGAAAEASHAYGVRYVVFFGKPTAATLRAIARLAAPVVFRNAQASIVQLA